MFGLKHRAKFLALFLTLQTALSILPVQAAAQEVAACSLEDMIEYPPVYLETFGEGAGRAPDPNVQNHGFKSEGEIQDGDYAVGISTDMSNQWVRTDLIGDRDADGNQNGRYLAINIRGNRDPGGIWTGEIYRANSIPMTPPTLPTGATLAGFRFSTALAGTCNGDILPWCGTPPFFTLYLENAANGAVLASATSAGIGVRNDDVWRDTHLNVVPAPSVTAVNLMLFNSEPNGLYGNDVGIDNITFRPLICEPPVIRATKGAVLDNSVTGSASETDAGDQITYTYTYTKQFDVDGL